MQNGITTKIITIGNCMKIFVTYSKRKINSLVPGRRRNQWWKNVKFELRSGMWKSKTKRLINDNTFYFADYTRTDLGVNRVSGVGSIFGIKVDCIMLKQRILHFKSGWIRLGFYVEGSYLFQLHLKFFLCGVLQYFLPIYLYPLYTLI